MALTELRPRTPVPAVTARGHRVKQRLGSFLSGILLTFCTLLISTISSTVSAQSTRPFLMATTAAQFLPLTPMPYRNSHPGFPMSEVAQDVDMITLWPEYLGIPYDIFAQGPSIDPTHPWAVAMQQLADDIAATGKDVFLQLGFIRTGTVGWAYDVNGELQVVEGWAGVCYDFTSPGAAEVGDGFVNYAVWMAQTFQPRFLVNFIEANLYYHDCGGPSASWDEIVAIQKRAYNAVKQVDPNLPVFPSIKLASLYGQTLDGFQEDAYQATVQMHHDMLGMSSYPYGITVPGAGRLATPYDLPPDYLVRIKLRHPEETLGITETGWNANTINIGDTDLCIQNFPYSEPSWSRDFMQFVFASAYFGEFAFVNWWSNRDFIDADAQSTCFVRDGIPYAQCGSDPWCAVMNYIKDVTFEGGTPLFSELVQKAFGSMGLKEYDGTERSIVIDTWRAQRAVPYAPQ